MTARTISALVCLATAALLLAAPSRAADTAPAAAAAAGSPAPAPDGGPDASSGTDAPAAFTSTLIVDPKVFMPKGPVKSAIFLISDAGGWSDNEAKTTDALVADGAIVIGIDLPSFLATVEKDTDEDCSYIVSDMEDLSQQTQRAAKNDIYRLPIVAGLGAGGAMALAIAAQTPDATIGGTLAVDPEAGIVLKRSLCTPAKRDDVDGKAIYGLTEGTLPNPIDVVFTPAATKAARDHVADLEKEHDDIDVNDDAGAPDAVLTAELKDMIATGADETDNLGLPITVLETKANRNAMAVVYSGDGGWRDLDKTIGDIFQKDGVPTVGVDSLRYFWSKRTPEETARDLQKIIDTYRKRWRVERVLLVGYSFGADILPAAFDRLSKPTKASIAQISLLGLGDAANYQISVMGWLGVDDGSDPDTVAAVKKIDPAIVQCVYGTDEDDSACLKLKDTGAELLGIDGGHHFDGDYEALAAKILASLHRRMGTMPVAVKSE